MSDNSLVAAPRTETGSGPAKRLRREGLVPATVYGLGNDSVSVTVPARELTKILSGESGANTLITLAYDGSDVLTLARQIHRHPTRGELVHVDFVRIRRDQAVSAEIPVHVLGESVGVKDGGLQEQLLFSLTVSAKPEDIPVALELDAADLAIGDQLHVSDLPLPAGVTTEHDPEAVVVQIAAPRLATAEEEAAEAGEAVEGGESSEAESSADGDDD